jgi:hypothetical protein
VSRRKNENPARVRGGVSGTLVYGFLARRLEGSVRETQWGRQTFLMELLAQTGERPDASEQGVYQHPEQRSEANQSAEYGDN